MKNAHTPPTDEPSAIEAGSTRDRLRAAREVAGRLMLSSPGEDKLRGLLMELVTILVGDECDMHHALRTSGALFPAPSVGQPMGSVGPRVTYHVQNPLHPPPATAPTQPTPPPPQFQPRPAPGPVVRHVPPHTRPLSIEEASRGFAGVNPLRPPPVTADASAETEVEPPIPIRATTHDGQPDPEGDQFLASLADQLNTQEEGG